MTIINAFGLFQTDDLQNDFLKHSTDLLIQGNSARIYSKEIHLKRSVKNRCISKGLS